MVTTDVAVAVIVAVAVAVATDVAVLVVTEMYEAVLVVVTVTVPQGSPGPVGGEVTGGAELVNEEVPDSTPHIPKSD